MLRFTVLILTAIVTCASGSAWACGGCFSPENSSSENTVVQNAERVLFVPSAAAGKSEVWIEVVYSGAAQDFGWVLPLPKQPKVSTGTRRVFDALDAQLQFRVARIEEPPENCRDPRVGCDPSGNVAEHKDAQSGTAASDAMADTYDSGPISVPGVTVLDSGSTGPYNYAVIQGKDASALYTWLTTNGYATPAKAKPILQIHADKGDVFLAIKLQNGQGINAIRPVVLQMDTAEPCVPLRLTSIAAAQEMSVVVTVAGAGRAIVKNHFDAVVNPLRLTVLGNGKDAPCPPDQGGASCQVPGNYDQVVSAAIDEAAGHAFVTEASVKGATLAKLSPLQDLDLTLLKSAKNVYDLSQFLAQAKLQPDGELLEAMQGAFANAGSMFMGAKGLDVLAALQSCGIYWQNGGADACNTPGLTLVRSLLSTVTVDGAAVAGSVQSGIIDPLFHVADLLAASARTTRLVLRISPDEMDRDPVFAFHGSLPEVAPTLPVRFHAVCKDGWQNGPQATRMAIAGMGSWLIADRTIIDPLFLPTPTALAVSVQEETGDPVQIDQKDRKLVDQAIAGALPGKVSIPTGMMLASPAPFLPPPSAPPVTVQGAWHQPGDCVPLAGWVDGQPAPGDVPLVDAGPTDSIGQSDAVGGDDVVSTPTTTSSRCTAGRTGDSGSLALACALACVVLWRMRRA